MRLEYFLKVMCWNSQKHLIETPPMRASNIALNLNEFPFVSSKCVYTRMKGPNNIRCITKEVWFLFLWSITYNWNCCPCFFRSCHSWTSNKLLATKETVLRIWKNWNRMVETILIKLASRHRGINKYFMLSNLDSSNGELVSVIGEK